MNHGKVHAQWGKGYIIQVCSSKPRTTLSNQFLLLLDPIKRNPKQRVSMGPLFKLPSALMQVCDYSIT